MSAQEKRFAQLRQMGFVNVDKWEWGYSYEKKQQNLLAVLRNDPQATRLG